MVVPYQEKEITQPQSDSPQTKISNIVNNKNLNKQDKVKLINQLLVIKQPNWPTSDALSNNLLDESNNEMFDDINDDGHENSFNNTKLNATLNKTAKSVKNTKKKLPLLQKIPASVVKQIRKSRKRRLELTQNNAINESLNSLNNESVLNNAINDLNETTNNAQFFLPPAISTRQKTSEITNPISFSSDLIQKNITDLVKTSQKNLNLKEIENKKPRLSSNPYTVARVRSDDKIEKQKNSKKQLKITPKTNINNVNLNNSEMEFEQSGGNFWSIYK